MHLNIINFDNFEYFLRLNVKFSFFNLITYRIKNNFGKNQYLVLEQISIHSDSESIYFWNGSPTPDIFSRADIRVWGCIWDDHGIAAILIKLGYDGAGHVTINRWRKGNVWKGND